MNLQPARPLALTMLSLCLAPVALAAPSIPLPWSVGTRLQYDATTVIEKVSKGVRTASTTRAVSTVEILEASETGFVQSWRDNGATVGIAGDAPDRAAQQVAAQALLERFDGVAMEVNLDKRGAYTGVRNWQALGNMMRTVMLPAMRAQLRAAPAHAQSTDAQLDATLQPMLDNLTSQRFIDVTLGKNPTLYNQFTAPAAVAGKPVRYEAMQPSPVSDHQIPVVGQFEVVGTDEAANSVTLRWTQSIDPVKGPAVLATILEAVTGKPLPADDNRRRQFVLDDEATVVLRRDTGVPLRLHHRRRAEFGGQLKTETWTLRLRPTPGQ